MTASDSVWPPPAILSRSRQSSAPSTHVPSLASHAFFRPMSSQRLQAQRSRPNHVTQQAPNIDGFGEMGSGANGQGMGSNAAGQPQRPICHDTDLPTPSRGTDFSEADEADTINASPTGNATVQSIGDSERPLQTESSKKEPKYQSPNDSKHSTEINQPVQKNNMTFSANFYVSTKRDMLELGEGRGPNLGPSPNAPAVSASAGKTSQPGINYQYFSGNTGFCCRGRLQNARGPRANIITAVLVLLPTALFFGFSYAAFQYPSHLKESR